MSYILDALRRAEAERGRGGVPGLHTPATPAPGALPAGERAAPSSWIAVVLGVLVVAVAAAGGTWWALQRSAPTSGVVLAGAPSATVPAAPSTSPVQPATSVASSPMPSPAGAEPAPASAVPAATPPPIPAPRPTERRVAPAPAAAAAPRAPVAESPRPRTAESPRGPAPTAPAIRPQETAAAVPTTPAAPTAPTGTVFAQSDLPDAVRAQLPALKISGATYSANPVYRMAIVNGAVLNEGDLAAPGLVLEKIEPGRTIWSFRGYRYGLASQ